MSIKLNPNKIKGQFVLGESLEVISSLPDESIDMIYIDPPFNTGIKQRMQRLEMKATGTELADRKGFGGKTYKSKIVSDLSYNDSFDDYLAFIEPYMKQAHRLLKPTGTLYFHIDPRESHYCKVLLDTIFGRKNFLNEIIWSYDYGAKSRKKWPSKHDTILFYAKDESKYVHNWDAIDRIPYMAPGLVTPEKAAKGKRLTDVIFHTIVPTNGKERTGYPTQKPIGLLQKFFQASTKKGDLCLDFFAGSGSTGATAKKLGRRYLLVDQNPASAKIISERLEIPISYWNEKDNPLKS